MRQLNSKNTVTFYFMDIEGMVPENHPLRKICAMTGLALTSMKDTLDGLYQEKGRPCIPPEMLLRSLLLQMLYSIRSERLLVEQLEYNMLFHGLSAWSRRNRFGIIPRTPRIDKDSWTAIWRGNFSKKRCSKQQTKVWSAMSSSQ